jgi:divalent metal cation (Fe/Co/Zn/Cd) transporter
MRENEGTFARAAGQLPLASSGCCAKLEAVGRPHWYPNARISAMTSLGLIDRPAVVRRGQRLTWATIAYNSLEAVLSIGAGLVAGSVALVGFGFDSLIELTSSLAGLWRLRSDAGHDARVRSERLALRIIGICFLLLAGYVLVDAALTLIARETPRQSPLGLVIAGGSLVVMPLLARARRRVAAQLASTALRAEARQTEICTYLSAILLGGLGLNALLGWWWADPLAALVMVPLIGKEGLEAVRGRSV